MLARSSSTPIGLTELIYQVKRELLQPAEGEEDPYPLLVVDEIELEIAIAVTKKGEAGLSIQVLSASGGAERSHADTVRVKLSPILTREERLTELRQDPGWRQIVQEQMKATLKGRGDQAQIDAY